MLNETQSMSSPANSWHQDKLSVIKDIHRGSSDGFILAKSTLDHYDIACPLLTVIQNLWEQYLRNKSDQILFDNISKLKERCTNYLEGLDIRDGKQADAAQKVESVLFTLETFLEISPKAPHLLDQTKEAVRSVLSNMKISELNTDKNFHPDEEIRDAEQLLKILQDLLSLIQHKSALETRIEKIKSLWDL